MDIPNKYKYISHRPLVIALILALIIWLLYVFTPPVSANPGVNEQINFQGRLFTEEGATVPDGFYNIQFKIYSGGDGQDEDNPSGTLLWTEDHLNDNDEGVTIQNGFLSVALGSIETFDSSIDWNDDTLWLSINVANTDENCSDFENCNPDGEMLPMKRLTATPYSLNSAMLGGIPSSGFVQLGRGLQEVDSSTAAVHLNQIGSGDLLDLQANGESILTLSQAGDMEFGGDSDRSISVRPASSDEGSSLTVSAGDAAEGSDMDGGDLVLRGGSGDGTGDDGAVRVESILEVADLADADNDTIICHNSSYQIASCDASFADESYVTLQNAYENGNTIQTNGSNGDVVTTLADNTNFIIDHGSGSNGRFAVQNDGADVLGVTSSDVEVNGDFQATGNTVAQAAEDGANTFQLQNANGAALFSLSTTQEENVVANSGAEETGTFSSDWNAFDGNGTATIARNDSDQANIASGNASVQIETTTDENVGVRNNLASNPETETDYIVSFSARLGAGSAFSDLEIAYSPDGGTNTTNCDNNTYNTQEIVDTEWRRITCVLTTPSDSVSQPNLIIRQSSAPGSPRTFYVDNVSMIDQNAAAGQSVNSLRVGGATSQGPTLLTLDSYADAPFTGADTAFAGSMYFDTTQSSIQCYDGSAWTACGATPDSSVTLTPEYAGAILNGDESSGVGVMTADFCANDSDLSIGDLCESGESRSYYQWTSPQASMQSYSIFVSYELPPTFESFADSNTIRLTWRTDSANGDDGTVAYQVFRDASNSGVTSCDGTNSSTETNPSADTWHTTIYEGDEIQCGFSGNDRVIFKIDVSARNNANVYVEDLQFTYTHQ